MRNPNPATIAASVLMTLTAFAPTMSRADEAASAPAIIQLPAIACAGPLAKIKADYKAYYQSRIDVANHFVSDQVDALKNLKEATKGQRPAIRALMAAAVDGTPEAKTRAMNSVASFVGPILAKASQDFYDESFTSGSWNYGGSKRWEETMNTEVMLSNGDYAVAACSTATYRYAEFIPYNANLTMCSFLDLETGTIWGDAAREALQLAGNNMDEVDHKLAAIAADYPMCASVAGFSSVAIAKVSQDQAAKRQEYSSEPAQPKPLYQNYQNPAN